VNAAIVFIEAFNHNIAAKQEFFDALLGAGVCRFRAIALTTVSTCGGLMPIILERDLQAQVVVPMAVSIAAGVAFATLLTLVLIPCLLAIGNDARCMAHYARHREWPVRELVEPGRGREDDPEIHIHPDPAIKPAIEPAAP
jgi:Cu/Ag efflux pump CusA